MPTRREFIQKSGLTLISVGATTSAFSHYLRLASASALTQAAALSSNENILVVIQLAGGNDGLNTVIPMDGTPGSIYRQRRPTLAVPEADILPLGMDAAGNQLGFHPNLHHFKSLFDQGLLSVIQSVGYPNPNRSHFRSMDIWHTANPDALESFGWLGDYLDVSSPSNDLPLLAVALTGDRLPLSLSAKRTTVPSVASIQEYRLRAVDRRYPADERDRIHAFLAMNREGAPERELYERIRKTALSGYESAEALQDGIRRYTTDPTVVYPASNPLARALHQAAQIISGELGTKILYVILDGFDTHQGQLDRAINHPLLLAQLDEAVGAFYQDMRRVGMDERILIMTWSEFGRKLGENGNQGTDHGASAPQFVIGGRVRGGLFGQHPSLTDVYTGLDDTKHTIDFRSLYATILDKWMGVDSREILGGSFEPVAFI